MTVFHTLPTLKTERLLLRKLQVSDAEALFDYASDPKVARWTTWDPHESLDDSKAFLSSVIEAYQNNKPSPWGVILKENALLIGTTGFCSYHPKHRRAEVGYALSLKHWGCGYATEALKAVVDFGFSEMKLNKIEGYCRINNTASARVMEKVNMHLEGILRQHIYVKGVFHDMKMYSLIKSE